MQILSFLRKSKAAKLNGQNSGLPRSSTRFALELAALVLIPLCAVPAVPHTSTFGLPNATIPYLMQIADKGLQQACQDSKPISEGVYLSGRAGVPRGS